MNFKIISHTDTTNYNDFKRDFTDPKMTVKRILSKYDLSRNRYNNLRKRVLKETNLTRKPYSSTVISPPVRSIRQDTYIRKQNGKYFIQKKIDGKRKSFGTYKDKQTARMVRDKLIASDWDKELARELKDIYECKPRMITDAMEKKEAFTRLYLNGVKVPVIKKELNLTDYQYIRLSKIVREEKNIKSKKILQGVQTL